MLDNHSICSLALRQNQEQPAGCEVLLSSRIKSTKYIIGQKIMFLDNCSICEKEIVSILTAFRLKSLKQIQILPIGQKSPQYGIHLIGSILLGKTNQEHSDSRMEQSTGKRPLLRQPGLGEPKKWQNAKNQRFWKKHWNSTINNLIQKYLVSINLRTRIILRAIFKLNIYIVGSHIRVWSLVSG